MEKVLVVVAHPDDEIIGVGGTLRKHINQGDEVDVLILGDGKTSRQSAYEALDDSAKKTSTQETEKALNALGITRFFKEYLPDNRFDSLVLLDLVKVIARYREKINPTIIYTHHYGDLNVDHQMTAEAVIVATRPIEYPRLKKLLLFETLSSTEMTGPRVSKSFIPNVFVDISSELDDKLSALSCYASEIHEFPHPRSLKAVEYNARVWGAKNNMHAAEAFFLFREMVN